MLPKNLLHLVFTNNITFFLDREVKNLHRHDYGDSDAEGKVLFFNV